MGSKEMILGSTVDVSVCNSELRLQYHDSIPSAKLVGGLELSKGPVMQGPTGKF